MGETLTFIHNSERNHSWSRRVLWVLIRQTCEVSQILVHLPLTLSMSAYPDDGYHFTGCFSRGRRPPSSQGNGSRGGFFTLPPFASFRSSRPTGRLLSRPLTTLVNFSFLRSFHSPAEHSYSHNQSQSQPERRNEYNDPLNDPSSTWSNYNTSRSTSSISIAVQN